jgi:hypothetical protein
MVKAGWLTLAVIGSGFLVCGAVAAEELDGYGGGLENNYDSSFNNNDPSFNNYDSGLSNYDSNLNQPGISNTSWGAGIGQALGTAAGAAGFEVTSGPGLMEDVSTYLPPSHDHPSTHGVSSPHGHVTPYQHPPAEPEIIYAGNEYRPIADLMNNTGRTFVTTGPVNGMSEQELVNNAGTIQATPNVGLDTLQQVGSYYGDHSEWLPPEVQRGSVAAYGLGLGTGTEVSRLAEDHGYSYDAGRDVFVRQVDSGGLSVTQHWSQGPIETQFPDNPVLTTAGPYGVVRTADVEGFGTVSVTLNPRTGGVVDITSSENAVVPYTLVDAIANARPVNTLGVLTPSVNQHFIEQGGKVQATSNIGLDVLERVGTHYGAHPDQIPDFTPGSLVAYGLGQGTDTTPNDQVDRLNFRYDQGSGMFTRSPIAPPPSSSQITAPPTAVTFGD